MIQWYTTLSAAVTAALLSPSIAVAHCDGLDGPVVSAAQKALDAADPNPVLIWVHKKDEPEVRRAFAETLAVRSLNAQARALADRYFFETLVRVHRASEGAPYTGLKPAGRDLGPAIRLADKAVVSGSDRELVNLLVNDAERELHQRLAAVQRKRNFAPADLAAGRDYVASYVSFIHYAEAIHQAVKSATAGHYEEDHPSIEQHH